MIRLICMFVCLAMMCTVLLVHARNEEKYTSKYDDIDVDTILANPRLRNQYVDCIMGSSPCITGAARYLKDKFAEAYVTNCKKCTDKQIKLLDKVADWFTTNEPDTWNRGVQIALREIQRKNQ